MILERAQINRYLRQILIPEISGPGQKKLLEAAVFICGEKVSDIAIAVYYLAATGVGQIRYQLADCAGLDELTANIQDLNPEVAIQAATDNSSDLRIFFGSPEFVLQNHELLHSDFVPTVFVLYCGWQGGLQVVKEQAGLSYFLSQLTTAPDISGGQTANTAHQPELLANCFGGALGAMELIKLTLAIGAVSDFLVYDLLTMEFAKFPPAEMQNGLAKLKAARQSSEPLGALGSKKVLIVGTGGLGSPVAYALALAGVGTIGLVDYDVVELSNLNRQILHAVSRLDLPKTESAALFLQKMVPGITVNSLNFSLNRDNALTVIAGYDLVVDAVDNFPSRFLLNDACFFAGKPLIDAGVIRFDGTARSILPQAGPCYRCTLVDMPDPDKVPSCSESGVLGPVPGIMGFIQAAEAVKCLANQGSMLLDRMLYFDGLFTEFITIQLRRNTQCPLCGAQPVIHELQQYEFTCADELAEENRRE